MKTSEGNEMLEAASRRGGEIVVLGGRRRQEHRGKSALAKQVNRLGMSRTRVEVKLYRPLQVFTRPKVKRQQAIRCV